MNKLEREHMLQPAKQQCAQRAIRLASLGSNSYLARAPEHEAHNTYYLHAHYSICNRKLSCTCSVPFASAHGGQPNGNPCNYVHR